MIQLNFRDARPIYAQITEGYRTQIRAGVLSEGDRLPSVRELASELTINPNTIQRAYRQLEAEGWIYTVTGKGCFVRGVPGMDGGALAAGASPRPTGSAEGAVEDARAMLGQFDRLAQALMAMGVTAEALAARLKGGNTDA